MGDTSSAYWLDLKDRFDNEYFLHPSAAVKGALWAIVVVLPIALVLHSLAAFKRARLSGFWLFHVDAEGYLQENRNVLMPVLSGIKTMLALACVISLQHDLRTHLHTYTLILQILAFTTMHSLNWMRTWGSVYSMPSTSLFNFNPNRTKSPFQTNERMLQPRLFNFFFLVGLLYGILLAAISTTEMCISLNQVNQLYLSISETLIENIILTGNPTSESLRHVKLNAVTIHHGMEEMQSKGNNIFWHLQVLILCFLAINFLSVTIFWWSLHTIIRCISTQLQAYKRSFSNMSEAIKLGMVSGRETTIVQVNDLSGSFDALGDAGSLEVQSPGGNSKAVAESIHSNWRMWLPTFHRNTIVADHFLWKSPLMGQVTQKGPNQKGSLRRQYELLRRFKINTLWQSIFITLMALSYQAMGITLKANAFDVPKRTSLGEIAVISVLWSNGIWAIGGTAMAALSALVAYSGTSPYEKNNVHEVQLEDVKSFDY